MLDQLLRDSGLEPGTLRQDLSITRSVRADGQLIATSDLGRYREWLRQPSGTSPPEESIREAIARAAGAFHSAAGTLTPPVAAALDRLRAGAPLLKISHQPNTFVSQNIATMSHIHQVTIPALQIRGTRRPVVIFVLIDYDVAGDARFRSATLPSNGQRPVRLRGAVPQRDHDRFAFAIKRPDLTRLDEWNAAISNAGVLIARDLAIQTRVSTAETRGRLATLLRDVVETWRGAASLVEWNSYTLSTIVNRYWGHDTLFLPASPMVMPLAPQIEEALDSLLETAPAATLVWRTCPACFARCRCESDNSSRSVVTICRQCGFEARERIDFSKSCRGPWGQDLPVFVPRVYLCDTMDLRVYKFAGGVTYAGGVAHTIAARIAYLKGGHRLPPEFIWEPMNLLFDHETESSKVPTAVKNDLQRGRYPSLLYMALAKDLAKKLGPPNFATFPMLAADGR